MRWKRQGSGPYRERSSTLTLAAAFAVGLIGVHGCSSGELSGDDGRSPGAGGHAGGSGGAALPDTVGITKTEPCYTAQQSFSWELYGPVFSRCIGCHNDFGIARQVGVELRLTLPGEPEFAEHNVGVLSAYATREVDAGGETLPLLLAKATGQIGHVGGQVLDPAGPEALLLASFVDKLADPPACAETPADGADLALAALTLSSPRATYARAKFVLTGELATPEELVELSDTEEMLDGKLDELMNTEAFLERAREMFADWLRTDSYSSLVRGNQLLNQLRDFPRNNYYLRQCTEEITNNCCDPALEACCVTTVSDPAECTEVGNTAAIDAVAREPLELVKHIVRTDLPMTELVTGNYAVINPYSARIYGFTDDQRQSLFDADPDNDATEFKLVPRIPTADNELRPGPDGGYPHAGILTMPSLLVRYPSSTSNQQRTRSARVILETLLAIPITKFADFATNTLPPDADLELATQQYPACTVCHAGIDPIAGNFVNFGSSGQYRPGSRAPEHLPKRGFLDQTQAEDDMTDPTLWLGAQVAAHERFPLGVLMPVLADLIGTEILTPPNEVLAEDYLAKSLAYRIQQLEIQRLRRDFAGPFGLRLKPLVKAIVKGPFFRAVDASGLDALAERALALAGVGPGTLLTPEQLARKIESATGLSYRAGRSATGRDMFRSFREYRLMFGGTDWDATPERYREPNAMAVRIALRMGNEVACVAVPHDLAQKDPGSRKLLPNVSATTTPDGEGEAQIRAEIRRLHLLLLNEDLPEGSPELEASYALWRASYDALSASDGSTRGRIQCDATESFEENPVAYPSDTHDAIEATPAVQAWVALVSYLLADGRFFLQ